MASILPWSSLPAIKGYAHPESWQVLVWVRNQKAAGYLISKDDAVWNIMSVRYVSADCRHIGLGADSEPRWSAQSISLCNVLSIWERGTMCYPLNICCRQAGKAVTRQAKLSPGRQMTHSGWWLTNSSCGGGHLMDKASTGNLLLVSCSKQPDSYACLDEMRDKTFSPWLILGSTDQVSWIATDSFDSSLLVTLYLRKRAPWSCWGTDRGEMILIEWDEYCSH